MAIGRTNTGGGGSVLNFEVVPGHTKPSNPKENTIWVKTDYSMHRWDISPDQPCLVGKKNLIVYPYYESDHTEDGITFAVNSNRTITANGTATAQSDFRFSYDSTESGMFILTPGTYTLSGCPAGGSNSTYALVLNRINDSGAWANYLTDTGSGNTFTVNRDTVCNVTFRVAKGATVSNLTVSPMLEKGSTATSFATGNATGQVWIKTSGYGSVSLNALKKNGIFIHPSAAYEFTTNNGWKKRDVMIYQNGAWKDLWDGYFFKAGNQYTDITGGWTTEGWTSSSWSVNQLAKINSDHLYVLGQNQTISAVGTVQKVDLSGVNTLKASINQSAGTFTMCICDSKNTSYPLAETQNTTSGTREVSLDVSGYNGSYYIILFAKDTGAETSITNVWTES